eukprot:scaffold2381_cov128-Cylindrotheca_fusiformis.AAC.9
MEPKGSSPWRGPPGGVPLRLFAVSAPARPLQGIPSRIGCWTPPRLKRYPRYNTEQLWFGLPRLLSNNLNLRNPIDVRHLDCSYSLVIVFISSALYDVLKKHFIVGSVSLIYGRLDRFDKVFKMNVIITYLSIANKVEPVMFDSHAQLAEVQKSDSNDY